MKLPAILFLLSLLWIASFSQATAGGAASNVTVSSQDLSAPGNPAQVLSVQAGPFNPPYSYTLPTAVTVTDPTTFTLTAVWPMNSQVETLGQVTVGVYGQVVGSVSIVSSDRLNPSYVRIDQPYHILFNTAGWTSADSNPQTLFLPYLYVQLSNSSALAASTATTDTGTAGITGFGLASTTESPAYQIPLPTTANAQLFYWPTPISTALPGGDSFANMGTSTTLPNSTFGIFAEWPDSNAAHGVNANGTISYNGSNVSSNWFNMLFPASSYSAAALNADTVFNPVNTTTGAPVPATWNCYAVLQNLTSSQYYATLVGSGNIYCYPLETATLYSGTGTTTPFPANSSSTLPVPAADQFVTSGAGTLLPTSVTAKITNMYPYSRFFAVIYPPQAAPNNLPSSPPSTTPSLVYYGTPPANMPTPYPPYYSVDNGTANSVTTSIPAINLYNFVNQSGNYRLDLCEYTPADTAVSTVYPQLASSTGASTITVPYGGTTAPYTPGLKVIQSYYFYVNFSVNVNGVIVSQ